MLGGAIALGLSYHSNLPTVSTGVYVAFLCIMLTVIFTSWLILPPQLIVRGDDTLVEIKPAISAKEEIRNFLAQCKDWRMLALLPMFFSSNFFYAYQGAITTFFFNGRTRALVSLLTGVGSVIGSIIIGVVTDYMPYKRRTRAYIGCGICLFLNLLVWSGECAFQVKYKRNDDGKVRMPDGWDFTEGIAAGPIILLMACESLPSTQRQISSYGPRSCQTTSPTPRTRVWHTTPCLPCPTTLTSWLAQQDTTR